MRLRFNGDQLENRSLPIYELGNALVSMQRIINKAYLFDHEELQRSAKLTAETRERIALQIGSRAKASDGYGLIPFVTDPHVLPVLQQVVATAITAIAGLAFYKAFKRKSPSVATNQPLIVAIYPDVRQLIDRIGKKGKVDVIELIPSAAVRAEPVLLNREVKRHIRELEREYILGATTTIRGPIVRLYARRFEVDIMFEKRRIRVRLSPADFRTVRYQAKEHSVVQFTGQAVYQLGAKTIAYKRFNGTVVTITKAQIADWLEEE